MIRVAVLGNSHLAAWKLAWSKVADRNPKVDFTFFGAPGRFLSDIEVNGASLVARENVLSDYLALTSGGKREIVASDYDMFCLVGLNYNVQRLLQLYDDWRADSHKSRDGTFTAVSDAVFEATSFSMYKKGEPFRTVKKIRQLSRAPIFIAPQPAPAESIIDSALALAAPFKLAVEAGDDRYLGELFLRISRSLEEAHLSVVDQPRDTFANPILTKNVYSKGAVGLTSEQRPERNRADDSEEREEHRHMNQAFGEAHIDEFLGRIGASANRR
jgi:hypothetical protein